MKLEYKQLKDCNPGQFVFLPGALKQARYTNSRGDEFLPFYMAEFDDGAEGTVAEGHPLCFRFLLDPDTAAIVWNRDTPHVVCVTEHSGMRAYIAGRVDRRHCRIPEGMAAVTIYSMTLATDPHNPYGYASRMDENTMVIALEETVKPTEEHTRLDIFREMLVALDTDSCNTSAAYSAANDMEIIIQDYT